MSPSLAMSQTAQSEEKASWVGAAGGHGAVVVFAPLVANQDARARRTRCLIAMWVGRVRKAGFGDY